MLQKRGTVTLYATSHLHSCFQIYLKHPREFAHQKVNKSNCVSMTIYRVFHKKQPLVFSSFLPAMLVIGSKNFHRMYFIRV